MPSRSSLSPPSSPSPFSSRTFSSSSYLSSPSSQTSPGYDKLGKNSSPRFNDRIACLPSFGRSTISKTRKARSGSRLASLLAIALAFYLVTRLCRSYDGLGSLLHEAETWRASLAVDETIGKEPGARQRGTQTNVTNGYGQNISTSPPWRLDTLSDRIHNKQLPLSLPDEDSCSIYWRNDDVVVVVLTSSTETQASLQSYLNNGLRCFPRSSVLLFSEVDDVLPPPDDSPDLGSLKIHSALKHLPSSIISENEEFALQATLTTLRSQNLDASSFATHHQITKLQKWRLLPAVLQSLVLRPNARWFMVVNTETYVSQHNLHLWLSSFNASEPQYRGGPLLLGSRLFGAIGAGIVLSSSAVKRLAETAAKPIPSESSSSSEASVSPSPIRRYPVRYSSESQTNHASERQTHLGKWYLKTAQERWSDMVLATALEDSGIRLNRSFPVLHSLNPWIQDWTENVWCRGKVTWGKMNGEMHKTIADMESKFLREVSWSNSTVVGRKANAKVNQSSQFDAMTYGDVFKKVLMPSLLSMQNLTAWNNFASDLAVYSREQSQREAKSAWDSAEMCEVACKLRDECVQWVWEPGRCGLGKSIKYGSAAPSSDERVLFSWTGRREGMVSGWNAQRMNKLVEQWADCGSKKKRKGTTGLEGL